MAEEDDSSEAPFGDKIGLQIVVSIAVLLTCFLFVCLCCISRLKRPRDEPMSALEIAEARERDEEELENAMAEERAQEQQDEAPMSSPAQLSLDLNVDDESEIVNWDSEDDDSARQAEVLACAPTGTETIAADVQREQDVLAAPSGTALEQGVPKEAGALEEAGALTLAGEKLPSTQTDDEDSRICVDEDEVNSDGCIDAGSGLPKLRGPAGATAGWCSSTFCQARSASREGIGSMVWKEPGLASL